MGSRTCLQKDMPGGGHSRFVDDYSDLGERSGGPELGLEGILVDQKGLLRLNHGQTR